MNNNYDEKQQMDRGKGFQYGFIAAIALSLIHIYGRVMKSLFIRTSFGDEIGNLSENPSFLQVHKSFVVNLRYAEKLKQTGLEMRNEDTVPVSKKRYAAVKRKYLSYMADRYR